MINKLNRDSITHIATSSTLQSLASFVKEVLENALDAKASTLMVCFFEQGRDGFEVVDNGTGILYADKDNLAVRGGTSKLNRFEDLESVCTHGFRGEALFAMSRLAHVTLTTKHDGDEMGWKWDFSNDSPALLARERGTTITVRDLFYPLPVRYSDYKNNYRSQYTKAVNLIRELAIINTIVEFKIYNVDSKGKQLVFESGPKTDCLKDRVIQVLGREYKPKLVEFEKVINETIKISGMMSVTLDSGSSSSNSVPKTLWFCFANGKPFNASQKLLKVISERYRVYNPQGKFVFILIVQSSREGEFDFNLSVDKRDIFIKSEDLLVSAVDSILEQKLSGGEGPVKQLRQTTLAPLPQPAPAVPNAGQAKRGDSSVPKLSDIEKRPSNFLSQFQAYSKQSVQVKGDKTTQIGEEQQERKLLQTQTQQTQACTQKPPVRGVPSIEQPLQLKTLTKEREKPAQLQIEEEVVEQGDKAPVNFKKEAFSEIDRELDEEWDAEKDGVLFEKPQQESLGRVEVIGQFNKGFILGRLDGQFYIFDQHACDEKRNYELLLKGLRYEKVQTVKPIRLELSSYQLDILYQHKQALEEKFHFRFRIDGAVVEILQLPRYEKVDFGRDEFLNLLENIEDYRQIPARVRKVVATQACRRAYKIGDALTQGQMEKLLKDMSHLDAPWNCPHGRPTLIKLNKLVLEKRQQGFSDDL